VVAGGTTARVEARRPTVKGFGVGLASAILIAGILVCLVLPAVMLPMDRRTWWLPRWAGRRPAAARLRGGVEPLPA